MAPLPTRRITATSCEVITTGLGKNNREYTIYEIAARGEDGLEITENLRSFEKLPLDVLIEVEVESFSSDRHGHSYTLKLPRNSEHKAENQSGSGLLELIRTQLTELRTELELLKPQVRQLRTQVAELRGEEAPRDETEVIL
jgi:hypothetical protein